MKIESIIRRQSGSTVKLGDQEYRFVPDDDGRHVCEVEDEEHIDRLLSIKEGFRLVDTDAVKPEASAAKPRGSRKSKDAVSDTDAVKPEA